MPIRTTVPGGLEWLAYVLATAYFVAALLAARLSHRAVLGHLFGLALLPFLACALVSFVRLQTVVSYVDSPAPLDTENLAQKLHEVFVPMSLGLVTTAVALVLHWLLCIWTRWHIAPGHLAKRLPG